MHLQPHTPQRPRHDLAAVRKAPCGELSAGAGAEQRQKSHAEILKERWGVLLNEAVNCKEVDRIMVLAAMIDSLMADVAEAGVSVK